MILKKKIINWIDRFNKKGTKFKFKDGAHEFKVIKDNTVLYYQKAKFFSVKCVLSNDKKIRLRDSFEPIIYSLNEDKEQFREEIIFLK